MSSDIGRTGCASTGITAVWPTLVLSSSDGDCRSSYECRDETKMMEHGGETVLAPGDPPGTDLQAFCAPAPTS